MRNALTIFKRDFIAYFTTPIGYIFMIVFLLISVGLYMTTFFAFPVADMRPFFSNLPLLLCIFIPAVAMRVWAEERKENTWEMLLTFPMRARELVLGKFLATFAFFALTLAATATVPAMLISLGNPDNGTLLGGYLGTLVLGAFFVALGIFVSAFCKDQIVAFVVSLLACFAVFLVGTDFVAAKLNDFQAGLGHLLAQAVGMMDHYEPFTRGVVEVVDLLYFLAWTVLFLLLNMMYLEGRQRAGARFAFAAAVALCFAIGLAFNWLVAGQSWGRADLTENKIYTVSDATESILRKLDAPVKVNVYITPRDEMPTQMASLEQDVTDKLDELRVASGGNLEYTVVHLRAANALASAEAMFAQDDAEEDEQDEAQAIEERMLDKGVAPFQVAAYGEDQVTTKLVYSSLGIGYRDKPEEIVPRVVPQTLEELEYRLVNTVYKLTREEPPVVALVAPQDSMPPEVRQMYAQMGQQLPPPQDPYSLVQRWLEHEKYDVARVQLTQDSPLPDEFDVLVVLNPQGLNDRQRYEINRALVSGKPVVLAVQQYQWDYRVQRDALTIARNPVGPEVNPLLEAYGLGVSKDVLMDVNYVPINVPGGQGLMALFGQPVSLPIQIVVASDSLNPDMSITNWLSQIVYLWGTALDIDPDKLDELGLDHAVLMTSTERAQTIPESAPQDVVNQQIMAYMENEPAEGTEYPLMVLVSGQFPDAFAGQPRPAWPPTSQPGMPPQPVEEEGEAEPIEPAPGRLILIGCAEPFSDSFLQAEGAQNKDLLMNSVDVLALGEDLINVRSKQLTQRTIERPEPGTRVFWKTVNYAGVNGLILLIGIAVAVARKHGRNAYTMAYASKTKQS